MYSKQLRHTVKADEMPMALAITPKGSAIFEIMDCARDGLGWVEGVDTSLLFKHSAAASSKGMCTVQERSPHPAKTISNVDRSVAALADEVLYCITSYSTL